MERRSEGVRQGVVVYCVCVDAGIVPVSAISSLDLGAVELRVIYGLGYINLCFLGFPSLRIRD